MKKHRWKKGDKVVVRGLDMAFVVCCYLGDNLVKLFIEGESEHTMHAVIHARPSVLLPNNYQSMLEEGWIGVRYINLTPHEIVVRLADGTDRSFPSEGNARVSVTQKEDGQIDGIPLFINHYGAVEGLPEYAPGALYIVSLMVINALKAESPDGVIRGDVVSPDSGPSAIRENGKIVAVRGFVRG